MQYFPEWTNFNPSDPGVTILEMFAWLKEMQQYHLNRITRGGVLACLRLLGISPQRAVSSEVTAVFKEKPTTVLTEGFQFVTDNGLVFEVSSPVIPDDVSISSIYIDTGNGPAEISGDVFAQGVAVEPFGPDEREGSCLYIGFTGAVKPEVKLFFEIYDDYPAARVPFGDDLEPSRDIVWTYGAGFSTEATVTDMTRGFSVSGEIKLGTDGDWLSDSPAPGMPDCYWLRARLVSKGSEESPKITRIYKDFTTMLQRETFSRNVVIETEEKFINLKDFIGINGEHTLFLAEETGWKHIPVPDLQRLDDCCEIKLPSAGKYCVVSTKPGWGAITSVETSLPGERFMIPAEGFTDTLQLMIKDGDIWYQWDHIDSLHTAGPHDRVFAIEEDSVVFGDNEHGACPPAGSDNIRISCCRMTRGAEGNILPHTLTASEPYPGIPVPDNITSAAGGRDAEKTDQIFVRVSKLLSERNRCVTCEDHELAAAGTPGTRILKTRAIEGYDPKTGGTNIPALVTVVVQPYGQSSTQKPNAKLLGKVRRHLEKGRLLTSRIMVAAPEYVPVSVKVDAIAAEGSPASVNIKEALLDFLSPVKSGSGIGKPVLVTDITAVAGRCAGVTGISGIQLNAPETAASLDRSGNVILPGHAIAYPGEIEINITQS